MKEKQWEHVKDVFGRAMVLSGKDRLRFLDEACANEPAVRREVEELLRSHDESGGFMHDGAVGEVAREIVSSSEPLESDLELLHYRILEPIGSGGMGEVYLATDTKLGRRVAIKVLPSTSASDDQANQRLLREARSAARLDHPNICTIHEIAEANGRRFIVMQYVEGENLANKIKGGSLNFKSTLSIAEQIAEALSEAHAHDIIHRDIKPANVIVNEKGRAIVLDFGLAKLVSGGDPTGESATARMLSTTGTIMGTVPYMSPEQVKGEKLDARTDIFSFGAMLYEMFTGEQPFQRDSNAEIIAALLSYEPAIDKLPDDLRNIVEKCLAKDKAKRYRSVDALLTDLRLLKNAGTNEIRSTSPGKGTSIATKEKASRVHDTSEQAEQTQILEPQTREGLSAKSTPAWRIAAAVIGLAAVAAAGLWFFPLRQDSSAGLVVGKLSQLTTWSALDDFPSMSPDGNSVAYCSDHNGTFEIYVKSLTPGAREAQLTNDGKQNFEPAWSPDGRHIAYHSKLRGGIWIMAASGGEAKQLANFGSHPAWSPDSKQIAFQSAPLNDLGAYARNSLPPSTLWLVASDGGEPRQLTQVGNPDGGHGSPAWSPDGNHIAFEANGFNQSAIWAVSLQGNDPLRISQPPIPTGKTDTTSYGYAPVYAPDGRSILYHAFEILQRRIDPSTNEPQGDPIQIMGVATTPSTIRRIAFSGDGKKMAFNVISRRESISSVTLKPNTGETVGEPRELVANATGRNNFPSFSHDGKRLAYTSCSTGGSECDIWLANSDGSNQIQLTTDDGSELVPEWFPGDAKLSFNSSKTGYKSVWAIDINTKRERILYDRKESIDYSRISPDGKRVAINYTKDGVINVATASLDGGELKQLTFDKELMGFPIWSPDGKYIALQVKRGDDTHLMIMPSEGGTPTQLTFDKGQSWLNGWSTDGDKLLFAGQRDGYWNVWWYSLAMKKEQKLTDYKKLNSFVRYPAWSPTGEQVAYELSETTGNIWVADLK